MTRRIAAVFAWLAVATMNASWVWAVRPGGFLAYMFASLALAERQLLTPGIRDEVDVDDLRTALAATASGAVHPRKVGVWLRPAPGTTR
jgi:hypothetical protein